SDKLRHDGSGLRNVILAAVSVITRPLLITNLNLFRRHSEYAGETCARSVDVLCSRDHHGRVRFHVGNGTVGSERRAGVVRASANLSHDVRSAGYRTCDISFFKDDSVLRFFRAHLRVQPRVTGKHRLNVPCHLQQLSCPHRIPLFFSYNANEIPAANHASAENAANRSIVNAHDFRAGAVSALASRPYDAAMQHSGHTDVLHIDILTAYFLWNVIPWDRSSDQLVLACRLYRSRTTDGK